MLQFPFSQMTCGKPKVISVIDLLRLDGILQAISLHANKLIQKWGQENAPPPAHVYSLEGQEGGGLQVIQKTFQGNFEVCISMAF